MRMNSKRFLAELVHSGKLKEQSFDHHSYDNLLRGAKKNIDAALILMNREDEIAFKCIYEGLLQIGRLILSLNNLRPDDGDPHKTTFQAAGAILGSEFDDLIHKIQKYRIKRNRSVYESDLLISRNEVEAILDTARQFWSQAKSYLKK